MSGSSNGTSLEVDDHAQTRVMLWCPPRSTSTILTKCLSFVPDSQVFFEPYYNCNDTFAKLTRMGKTVDPSTYDGVTSDDLLQVANMISGEDCTNRIDVNMLKYNHMKKRLENPDPRKKFILMKDIADTVAGRYDVLPDRLCGYRYSFLLRHPIKVFKSWRKCVVDVQLLQKSNLSAPERDETVKNFHLTKDTPPEYLSKGLFFKEMYDLWVYVKENLDPNPTIIDSDDLLSHPESILPQYCRSLGIPYTEALLRWDGHPDTADSWVRIWGSYKNFEFSRIFFQTALHTTHFLPPSPLPPEESLTPDVIECVRRSMPYYQDMYEARIRP